jgi:predicted Fe-S protein YdhL (DUF1289 family)
LDIETPCTKVCRIAPDSGLCAGCRRTIDEIMRWREMTPAERRAVMAALPGRSPGR